MQVHGVKGVNWARGAGQHPQNCQHFYDADDAGEGGNPTLAWGWGGGGLGGWVGGWGVVWVCLGLVWGGYRFVGFGLV